MTTLTRDEVLQLIREELPSLLETDAALRHELFGLLAEVFPPRREFEEALARIDRSIAAMERAIDAFRDEMARLHAGQEALQQDISRLDAKTDAVREELSARIEATREELGARIDATREELSATREELGARIDATREHLEKTLHDEITKLGQRWGLMSEDLLRGVIRTIVRETYGGQVTETVIDGEQYDYVITDGDHILLEVTARASQKIIRRLERKRARYVDKTGITPTRVILATAQIHHTVATRLQEMGIEVIQPEVLSENEESVGDKS